MLRQRPSDWGHRLELVRNQIIKAGMLPRSTSTPPDPGAPLVTSMERRWRVQVNPWVGTCWHESSPGQLVLFFPEWGVYLHKSRATVCGTLDHVCSLGAPGWSFVWCGVMRANGVGMGFCICICMW